MHTESRDGMRALVEKYLGDKTEVPVAVLDIGSRNVNGSYREILPATWRVTGVDIVPGKDVDVLMNSEFNIPLEPESADLVISGSCLEHCRNPYLLVLDAARILRSGGLMILTCPRQIHTHRYPLDCFRILEDGMRALLEQVGCDVLEVFEKQTGLGIDAWGVGRKR